MCPWIPRIIFSKDFDEADKANIVVLWIQRHDRIEIKLIAEEIDIRNVW